jgi:ERF superfamily protein
MSTDPALRLPIAVLLARVAADVRPVGKGDRNEAQGFAFRGVDSVLREVAPAMRTHGVILTPHVEAADFTTVEIGQRRTAMRQCTLRVRYVFHGPAGDHLDAVVVGEAIDSGDKAASKAMSVALRTMLIQVFAIPVGDRDPDHDSYERAEPDPARTPARQTPVMAVIEAARAAGIEGDGLAADVAARHQGATLAELDEGALRGLWSVYRDVARLRAEGAEQQARQDAAAEDTGRG